jgi:membrane protein required for colicin V production
VRLDLAVLGLLAISSIAGAVSGALRQVVSLAAVALGALAARAWTDDVAAGLARTFRPLAGLGAPVLLFLGVAALASLVGALLLRGTGLARAVRTPADRGAGALLGGAKGALAAWVLLSALALAGPLAPGALARLARDSDLYALARRHNLLERLDPRAAGAAERATGRGGP